MQEKKRKKIKIIFFFKNIWYFPKYSLHLQMTIETIKN